MLTRRTLLTQSTKAAAAVLASRFFVVESFAQAPAVAARLKPSFDALDRFVEQYMREMGAPGMTLALADRNGIVRIATYGFSDVEGKQPVAPDQLFHIGSISKSFIGIALLQSHEAGKIDLHKPVTDYVPWFRIESKFAPINTHHLLTHSSGLPGAGVGSVFLSDPDGKHIAAYPPGEHFHYCNMGYTLLGHLLWAIEGKIYPDLLRDRIFKPLGMDATEPVITSQSRERTAKSYMVYHDERPYPRAGRIAEAPGMIVDTAAGSIASTPHDMALYMQMLLSGGQLGGKRILSAESLAAMTKPHIKATDFGATASYGYGIAIDTLDGHRILRHTGGMVSFMSAMQLDMDEGVGAFASINAQQGYRPNPVCVYALKLMRAANAGQPITRMPPPNPPTKIEKAEDYARVYTTASGKKLQFVAEPEKLFLLHDGQRLPVEAGGASFIVRHPAYERSGFVFARDKSEKAAVTEVSHGDDWYTNDKYTGPKQFTYPKDWDSFTGHYRNDNPWSGSFKVILRKGTLFLDNVVPLEPIAGHRFRLADKRFNPEWIEFRELVNGKAMHVKFSGDDFWRVWA